MIAPDDTKTLPRPARAFAVDATWYEAHWYGEARPTRGKRPLRFTRLLVWAAILVAGAYVVGHGAPERSSGVAGHSVHVMR